MSCMVRIEVGGGSKAENILRHRTRIRKPYGENHTKWESQRCSRHELQVVVRYNIAD